MYINPINYTKFGDVNSIEIQNLERKIEDLQISLDKREIEDIKRKSMTENRPFYPPMPPIHNYPMYNYPMHNGMPPIRPNYPNGEFNPPYGNPNPMPPNGFMA